MDYKTEKKIKMEARDEARKLAFGLSKVLNDVFNKETQKNEVK